jgi:acetyl-CoA carboxylase/biotin carboxylase 1
LKQLTIRGDIHTTVEYLINLCETKDFVENRIDTAWLDKRIKENLKPEKPDTLLLVIACAAIRSYDTRAEKMQEYEQFCERGQLPPQSLLALEHDWKLIYEDVAYDVRIAHSLEINVRTQNTENKHRYTPPLPVTRDSYSL